MSSFMLHTTGIKREEARDAFHDSNDAYGAQMSKTSTVPPTQPHYMNSTTPMIVSGSIEQALLKSTIQEKCLALTAALKDNSNTRELQLQYPIIIQKIFGFGQYPPGWQIEITNRYKARRDCDAVLAFLHPNGPLFANLIYKLMAEDVVFNYPFQFLPEATKRKIDEGLSISELYNYKFTSSSPQAQLMLELDAFEYYFFIFAHKMTSSSTKGQELYLEPSEWLYPTLLDDYLQFFLPMTGMPSPSPCSPSNLNKSQQSSLHPHRTVSSPIGGARRVGLGLLKQTPSYFSRSTSVQQTVASDSSVDTDVMWRTEKLVQILAEMWLNQTSLDLPSQPAMRFSGDGSEKLPSHDLIMLVRMFVKHVHAFVNSSDGNVLPAHQQNPSTILGALKKNMLARYIQKPLYGFLKHSIEKWPLDTSFRPILETWLTFIRPWRYASGANESHQAGSAGGDNIMLDFKRLWEGFVRAHSLFYSVIFQDVLARFLRIDLTSSKMAYQLSRVCRVFDSEDLVALLRDVDMSVTMTPYGFQDFQESDVTAGAMGSAHLMLASQINSIEAPSFSYRPLFCEEVIQQVYSLMQEMAKSQQILRKLVRISEEKNSSTHNNSILSYIGLGKMVEFNDVLSSNQDKEYLNTDKWLEQSMNELSEIFKVQIPESDLSSSSATSSESSSEHLPDHIVKADGAVELTALGRYQVLNGLRRFPVIEYRCDPELQPVRSFESDFGVVQLYKLSCSLNKKYGNWFAEQYNKEGIIGCVAKQLLNIPPRSTGCDSYPQSRQPRLSLRVLANYYFLGYTIVGYLILSSLFGRLPTVLFAVLLFVLYIFISAGVDHMKERRS